MNKPNFFIVGAAKSGTTSLADYLRQHPQIFMSPLKEPFFFVENQGYEDIEEYLNLFEKAGNARIIGEASTGYLFDEKCAKKIYEFNSRAKILIILRNPIDMCFSYWKYMRLTGSETEHFEDAISPETVEYRRTDKFRKSCMNWWASYIYVARATYASQVSRYLEVFGKEKVKVVFFENFFRDKEKSIKEVFNFLEVDPGFTPDLRAKNIGGVPRLECVKKILNVENILVRKIVKSVFSVETRVRIKESLLYFNTSKRAHSFSMSKELRESLQGIFARDKIHLELILSVKVDCWKY